MNRVREFVDEEFADLDVVIRPGTIRVTAENDEPAEYAAILAHRLRAEGFDVPDLAVATPGRGVEFWCTPGEGREVEI